MVFRFVCRFVRRLARACLLMAMVVLGPSFAQAHPHVWVEARATVVFDKAGLISAIRNDWVFDEMYSAFAVQGLAKTGEIATRQQLAPLAKTNVDSLADYDYFTYAKAGGKQIAFAKPIDYWLEERPDKRVVLHFTLPLKTPTKTGRAMSFQIYDPTYYVDFELAESDPVALDGAPSGCSHTVLGANPLLKADGLKLAQTFDTGGTPGDDFALTMAGRVIVACP
jgi:ABC-type uncharacterized transport system substrate-binding protein